jgi:hypothetical protein
MDELKAYVNVIKKKLAPTGLLSGHKQLPNLRSAQT